MRFSFGKLLIFLVVSRIIIFAVPWLWNNLLYPESHTVGAFDFLITNWNRWDAPHYIYLAQHWYTNIGDAANFIVFFPLYPLLVKLFTYAIGSTVIAAIFSSTIFFFLGAYFLYEYVKGQYGEKIAAYTIIGLALFPTSYFFNSPYTESLFLFVSALTLFYTAKANWIAAGITSGLSTLVRPTGFLVLSVVLIEFLIDKKRRWRFLPIIIIPTIVAGLAYLYLNKSVFGNYFEFQKILTLNWQKHFAFPLKGILDSWRIALSGGLNNFAILVGWAEALSTTVLWILIPVVFRKLKKSLAVFYTLNVILLSSTSFILSTPRYILSIPPLFILLAIAQKNYWFKTIWLFISTALLISLSILFTRGQWAF